MISHQSTLIRFGWHPDLDMREIMRANALSCIDVQAGDPITRPILDELLGPPIGGWGLDKPFRSDGTGSVSTCSMVALGLLRRLGVDCADIRDGYADDIGSGLRVASDWAAGLLPRPAWVTPMSGLTPNVGDVVDLCPYERGRDRSNHTETLIGWAINYHSLLGIWVAGGQTGRGGLQAIHRVQRPWHEIDGKAYSGGRRVHGWIDIDLVPYSGHVIAPERVGQMKHTWRDNVLTYGDNDDITCRLEEHLTGKWTWTVIAIATTTKPTCKCTAIYEAERAAKILLGATLDAEETPDHSIRWYSILEGENVDD